LIISCVSIAALSACGTAPLPPATAIPSLRLEQAKTVSKRGPLGNQITWALPAGRYRAAFEDAEFIYYLPETPIVLVSPDSTSLGADSGIFVAKNAASEIKWGIFNGSTSNKLRFKDELVGFITEASVPMLERSRAKR
jgi:hypothetical protein